MTNSEGGGIEGTSGKEEKKSSEEKEKETQ